MTFRTVPIDGTIPERSIFGGPRSAARGLGCMCRVGLVFEIRPNGGATIVRSRSWSSVCNIVAHRRGTHRVIRGDGRPIPRNSAVLSFARHQQPSFLRLPHRSLAAFVMVMFVLAGALHGMCDLDVTNPSGKIVISLADNSTGHSEKGALGHHCHGCFSVSVPAPVTAAVNIEPAHKLLVASVGLPRGLPPGIDPPPPKYLT